MTTIMKRLCALLIIALYFSSATSSGIEKETYTFAKKASDTLCLDLYRVQSESPAPCVIFVFGGAFLTGQRDHEAHQPFFEYLHDKGYNVVSIDYRLGLSRLTKKETRGMKLIKKFKWAVDIAVEDLFDATNYVLKHAQEWNIDPTMIIASGSSAGAITVVQAENEICNGGKLSQSLTKGFNYAGVMSFAGAIMKTDGKPKWPQEPCPIIFFHGDADNFVPFNKVTLPGIAGFYGSEYLVAQLSKTSAPYYFYRAENVDHAMASLPLSENRRQLDYFLDKYVRLGEKLQITENHKDLTLQNKPDRFGLKDYTGSSMQYATPVE